MADDVADSGGPAFVCLARGDGRQLASLALVLEAMDIEYRIDGQRGELQVAPALALRAAEELQLYHEENAGWPASRPATVPSEGAVAPTVLMLSALVLLFGTTGPWTLHSEWLQRGMVDAQAIVAGGQWWRLITGLTLHADGVHLLSNVLLGGLLIHLLSTSVGYGLAWAMLLCAGTLGNALNVLLRQQPHHSVGFSTALFAVIGLLVTMQVVRLRRQAWRSMLLPLGAGAALLALLGSEGERTDLGAHLFGFLAGLLLCLPLGLPSVPALGRSSRLQVVLLIAAALVVIAAWWLAWR